MFAPTFRLKLSIGNRLIWYIHIYK
jgi:hypothetical protein